MFRIFFLLAMAAGVFAQCPEGSKPNDTTAPWDSWGNGPSNSRFQTADRAGIPANQVPKLKLKWAFGFPGVRSTIGQPAVAAGRVYIGTDNGTVYALDIATGCQYWTFKADAGVRNETLGLVALPGNDTQSGIAFFGDQKANVYALLELTGKLIWKVRVDDHPRALITGAPKLFENRVYVPVASGEEGAGGNPNYACCTFRGSVVALDAATGGQIWKTYTIAEDPKQVGKNSNGTLRWAPAGAGVWNSPTIDAKRRALYIGTGDAYTSPAAPTTDSIIAMNLDTGKILWSAQDTPNDTWLAGCTAGAKTMPENCPKDVGPDHDFGSPPILVTVGVRDLLIAGQKSGNVWAHDPDKKGAVVWKTPLVADTTQFGGKIIWGGAADYQNAYFGLGTGGIAAVQLRDGERQWFTPLQPAAAVAAHTGQDGPVTAIPGVVFSGGWDGVLRALSSADGKVVWEYNTVMDYQTVNGVAGKGGSMGAPGPVVSGGMLFAPSGYVGVKNGIPGNVVLAFSIPAE
jgi:polyvinyl alcohol dehydrogenase (cytochrome)